MNIWLLFVIIAVGSVILSQTLSNYGLLDSNLEPMTGTGGYADSDLIRNSTTGQIGLVVNGLLRPISYDVYTAANFPNRLSIHAVPNYIWNRIPMGEPITTNPN